MRERVSVQREEEGRRRREEEAMVHGFRLWAFMG
jgi:hypothetical protein